VIEEILFQQYFFYWFAPYTCWVFLACHRIFFGDGLFFWQEEYIGDDILDYEA